MFGWDGNNDGLIDIHTQPVGRSVQLANLIRDLENYYDLGLDPVIYNPGTSESDHGSFWIYGFSAVVFSEAFYGGDFNPYYQTTDDRVEYFNLHYFHNLAKLAVATISYLSINNIPTKVENGDDIIVSDYVLKQNYPNPFNPATTIEFSLPVAGFVTLKIYDLLGREISTLVAETLNHGIYEYQWDAGGLAGGIYFYQLQSNEYRQTRRMMLMR